MELISLTVMINMKGSSRKDTSMEKASIPVLHFNSLGISLLLSLMENVRLILRTDIPMKDKSKGLNSLDKGSIYFKMEPPIKGNSIVIL